MSNRFSKTDEDRLIDLLSEAYSHIKSGAHPDDAIVKVAREHDVHSDLLPLMVSACNVGQHTWQREKCGSKGVLCALEEFPVASVDKVRAKLYPSEISAPSAEKSAQIVSPEYSRPPRPVAAYEAAKLTKLASQRLPVKHVATALPNPEQQTQLRRQAKEAASRGLESLKIDVVNSRDRVRDRLNDLVDYFKQSFEVRQQGKDVEYNATALWGGDVIPVFDYVTDRVKFARANGPPARLQPVRETMQPYSLIRGVLKAANDYRQARQELQWFQRELNKRPAFLRPAKSKTAELLRSKSAGGFIDSVLNGTSLGITNVITNSQQARDAQAMNKLDDPDHLDMLRSIKAQTVLRDLTANDETISGYDPDEVMEAYNEIAQLSPNASTQLAVMRPMLRKRLAAKSLEPFETQQLVNMEKVMRDAAKGIPAPAGGTNNDFATNSHTILSS